MLEFFQWIHSMDSSHSTIVMICSLIAALTPTPIDDGWMKKVYKIIDWFALNVRQNKEKTKHFKNGVSRGLKRPRCIEEVHGKKKEKETQEKELFATIKDARATVRKVKRVRKSYARKIQILTVGEQRARVMGKKTVASIFKSAKAGLRKAHGSKKKKKKGGR